MTHDQIFNGIIGFNGIFGTDSQIVNGVIGMMGALTYFGIRRGIRAYRGKGSHKWTCPSCRFKVVASDALLMERVKTDHLRRSHHATPDDAAD